MEFKFRAKNGFVVSVNKIETSGFLRNTFATDDIYRLFIYILSSGHCEFNAALHPVGENVESYRVEVLDTIAEFTHPETNKDGEAIVTYPLLFEDMRQTVKMIDALRK